jgi:AraC-like DNA-binding protein
MKIWIKNMVCDRCILVIRNVLDDMGIKPYQIRLGEVDLGEQTLNDDELDVFQSKIKSLGFEFVSDKKSQLIEKIKNCIIDLVQNPNQVEKVKLSEYLSNRIFHDYTYLSSLFSSVESVTIEQYFINQKIEKAKELLVYDELNLTEIAYRLGYSSVAHLSRQFKKVTGQTPSQFKALRDSRQRKSIDKV